MSLTQLYAQSSSDTIRSYNKTDLLKIATKLIEGQACDTILTIAEIEILNRDSIIRNDSSRFAKCEQINKTKENLILDKDNQIKSLSLENKKNKHLLKIFKRLTGSSAVVAIGAILFVLVF